MGCPAEVCLYAPGPEAALAGFLLAESECRRLDRKYSNYRADSYLAGLQREAALPEGVRVDGETAALLNMAATLHEESHGLFDVTAGGLTALWEHRTTLPGSREIATALSMTGWHRVRWDGARLRLPAGVCFDLGGMVKEYAADRAAWLLKARGFESGFVDLGGDLHVLGPHPAGAPWRIGIRHPRGRGALASIEIGHGGLATSGDYERFTVIDGVRYGHIIDPTTGWPVRGLATVSVVARTCLLAGAVSTLAMLSDTRQGLEFLADSGLAWLAHDGRISFAGTGSAMRRVARPRRDASHASGGRELLSTLFRRAGRSAWRRPGPDPDVGGPLTTREP